MSGDWREKLRRGQGQKISEASSKSKILRSSMEDLLSSSTGSRGEIESREFIELALEQKSRFLPKMDFSDPSKFVKFASAEQYYKDSILRIQNTYPYDGSHTEKIKWLLESSYLDMYMFEVEYPRTTGFVNFKPQSWGTKAAGTKYGLSQTPEYIFFSGGPNADPDENYKTGNANIYNASEKRESNLAITSNGNTVEFWLKKDSLAPSSKTQREVVFDCHTSQFMPGNNSHVRMRIELDTTQEASHWLVTLLSGSSSGNIGISEQQVGIGANITGSSWHHHAFTFAPGATNLEIKYYNNGVLNDTKNETLPSAIADVRSNLVASIGALSTQSTSNSTTDGVGYGQMSGSLDDFRYWKTARDAEQIGLNYNLTVHGGTNKSLDNVDLGVYYKFNEGIAQTSSVDQNILDFSGRISNGNFVGYNQLTRNTGSALSEYNSFQEKRDPILYSFHPEVKSLYDSKVELGRQYDYTNSAALINTLPSWILDDGLNPVKNGRSTLKELCQIVSSYFDTLFYQVKNLPQLKHMNYSEFSNLDDKESLKPYPFMDKILSSFSFNSAEIFSELTPEERILNKDDTISFGRDIDEVKDFIYKNIYNNLSYIYKSKGTEASFRNLIRCFGIGREIIDITAYSDNYTYKLEDKFIAKSSKTRAVNFASTGTSEASIHQGLTGFSECFDYVPGISSPEGHTISYSVNLNAPAKLNANIYDEVYSSTLYSSIFGVVTPKNLNLESGDTTTKLSSPDLRLYLIKDYDTSSDAYFCLESTSMDVKLTSPIISRIYDDNNYNIAVVLRPTSGVFGSHVSGSSDSYNIILSGISYSGDYLEESFRVTESVEKVKAESFLSSNKRHYVGAEKQNLTGSIVDNKRSDLKIISFRKYLSEISEEDQKYHALDSDVFGLDKPLQDVNLFIDQNSAGELNKYNSMVLNWEFNTLTGSNSEGSFDIYDMTSKTPGFGILSNIISNEYPARGHGFPSNDKKFAINHITPAVKQSLPETMFSSDMVTVKKREEGNEKFHKDSRPIVRQYNFEKNMYRTISEEMMKFVGSVASLGDLIGDPVNKYRKNYKDMEKVRQHFFKFVDSDLDLEKYLTYYRWLDTSISHMIDQLKPATVEFSEDIRTMVESHVFERSKYEHKFPTIEFVKQEPEAPILGINELLYDWEHGHAPILEKTPATAAVGKVRCDGGFINNYDTATLTLESTDGTERVYVFDKDTAPPSSGTAVNISGLDNNKAGIAAQLALAINSTGGHENKILAVSDGDPGTPTITLTQLVKGAAGNTTIAKTDPNSGGLEIDTQFEDGADASSATPNQGNNCLWWSDRAERNESSIDNAAYFASSGDSNLDNEREALRQFINSDVSGSTYALRKFARPYRLTMERDIIYKSGHNFDKANKLFGLYEQKDEFETSINFDDLEEIDGCQDKIDPEAKERLTGVFESSIADNYLDADADLVLPFSIHSSSVNTGYVAGTGLRALHSKAIITNLHSDATHHDGEIPMQGPFTNAHVGGNTHRHVSMNSHVDQSLRAVATIKFGNVPSVGEQLTIKSTSGLSKTYTAAASEDTGPDREFLRTPIDSMGASLVNCITAADGHNGEIQASYNADTNTLTLTQRDVGPEGNTAIQQNLSNLSSIENFSGGVDRRPEDFTIEMSSGKLRFKNPVGRISMFRNVRTKRPVNISNIKSKQDSYSPIGNYTYDYEVVHVATDNFNGDMAQFRDSFHITGAAGAYEGVVDITNPPSFKDEYNIISRFSRIGGTTWRKNYLSDPLYGDMSPYNSIAYANLRLRNAFSSLHAEKSEQFGLRTGSMLIQNSDYELTSSHSHNTPRALVPAVGASIHKVNRNPSYYREINSDIIATYDNANVIGHIPKSDIQYTWIRKATKGIVHSASWHAPFRHESAFTIPSGLTSSIEKSLTFLSSSEFGIAGNTAFADRFYLNKNNPHENKIPLTVYGIHKDSVIGKYNHYNNVTASSPGNIHPYDGLLFVGDPKILQYDRGLLGILLSEDFEAYESPLFSSGAPKHYAPDATPVGFESGPYTTAGSDKSEHGVIQFHLPAAMIIELSGSEDRSTNPYSYYWNATQLVGNKVFTITDGATGNSVTYTYTNCSADAECQSSTELNYGSNWTVAQAAAELSRKINESALHITTKNFVNTDDEGVIALAHLTGSTRAEVFTKRTADSTVGGIYMTTNYEQNAWQNNPDFAAVGITPHGVSDYRRAFNSKGGGSIIDPDTYHYFNYGLLSKDVPAPAGHPKHNTALSLGRNHPHTRGTIHSSTVYDPYAIPEPPFRELADISPAHAMHVTNSFSATTRVDPRSPNHPWALASMGEPEWAWITTTDTYTVPVAVSFGIRVGNYGATDRGAVTDEGDPYLMMNNPFRSGATSYPSTEWPQALWFQYKVGANGTWKTPPGARFDNYYFLDDIDKNVGIYNYDLPLETNAIGTINVANDADLAGGPGNQFDNGRPVMQSHGIYRNVPGSPSSEGYNFDTSRMNLDNQFRLSDNTGSVTFTFKSCTSTANSSFNGCAAADELHVRSGTYHATNNNWSANEAANELATKINESSLKLSAAVYPNTYAYNNSVYIWHDDPLQQPIWTDDPNGTNNPSGITGISNSIRFVGFKTGGGSSRTLEQVQGVRVVTNRFVESGDEIRVIKDNGDGEIIWRGIVQSYDTSTGTIELKTFYTSGEKLNSSNTNIFRVLRIRKNTNGLLDGALFINSKANASGNRQQFARTNNGFTPNRFFINAGQDEANPLYLRWIKFNQDDGYDGWAIDNVQVQQFDPAISAYPWHFSPYESSGLNQGLVWNIDSDTNTSSPLYNASDKSSDLLINSISTSSFSKTLGDETFKYYYTSSYDYYPAFPLAFVEDLQGGGVTVTPNQTTNVSSEELGMQLNAYIFNKLGRFGYNTWDQLRKDYNKFASVDRRNNNLSITFPADDGPTRFVEPAVQQDSSILTISDRERPQLYQEKIDAAGRDNGFNPGDGPQNIVKHKSSFVNLAREKATSLEPQIGRAFVEVQFMRQSWLTEPGEGDNSVQKSIWNSGYDPMLSLTGLTSKYHEYFGDRAPVNSKDFKILKGEDHAVVSASYSYNDPYYANEEIPSKIKEKAGSFSEDPDINIKHEQIHKDEKKIRLANFLNSYNSENSRLIQVLASTWPPAAIQGLKKTRTREGFRVNNRVEYEIASTYTPFSTPNSWEEYNTSDSDVIYSESFDNATVGQLPPGWTRTVPGAGSGSLDDTGDVLPRVVESRISGDNNRVLVLAGDRQPFSEMTDPPINTVISRIQAGVTYRQAVQGEAIGGDRIQYRWVQLDRQFNQPFYVSFRIYAGTDGTFDKNGDHLAGTDAYSLSSPGGDWADAYGSTPFVGGGELVDPLWFQYRIKTTTVADPGDDSENAPPTVTFGKWTTVETYTNDYPEPDFGTTTTGGSLHNNQRLGRYSGKFTTKKYLIDYGQSIDEQGAGTSIELRWVCSRTVASQHDRGDEWAIDNIVVTRATERQWLKYSGFYTKEKDLTLDYNTSCGIDAVDVELHMNTNVPDGEELNLSNINHLSRSVSKIRTRISPWPLDGRSNLGEVSSSSPISEFYPAPIHNADFYVWSLKNVENPIYDGYLVESASYFSGSGARNQEYFYRPADPNGVNTEENQSVLSKLGLPLVSYSAPFPEPFLHKNDRKQYMYHFKYVDPFYYGPPSQIAGTSARFEPQGSQLNRGNFINNYTNFTVPSSSLDTRGLRGQGELQNDYTIYHMGISSLHVTPPPGLLYSRPVLQSIWSGPEQGSIDPNGIVYSFDISSGLHNGLWVANQGNKSDTLQVTGAALDGPGRGAVFNYFVLSTGVPVLYTTPVDPGVDFRPGDIIRFHDPSGSGNWMELTASKISAPFGSRVGMNSRVTTASVPDHTGKRGFQVLVGDAKWEAGAQSGLTPRYETYDEFRENFRSLEQNKSLVPEFRLSENLSDYLTNIRKPYSEFRGSFRNFLSEPNNAPSGRSLDIRNKDSLSLTGSSISTQNLQNYYTTSELSSSFGLVFESVVADKELTRVNLKAAAVMKLLPYKGFYPAERIVQMGNLFQQDYLSPSHIIDNIEVLAPKTREARESIMDLKISSSLSPAMKALFGPGILFNSIKSGLAVDYPIFKNINTGSMEISQGLYVSGTTNYTGERSSLSGSSGYRNFTIDPPHFMNPYGLHPYDNSTILALLYSSGSSGDAETYFDTGTHPWKFDKIRSNTGGLYGSIVTGSHFNKSVEPGKEDTIPKLKPGTAEDSAYRIPFEALYEPSRINDVSLYDNEPHPSASFAIGGYNYWKIMDFPYKFNAIQTEQLQEKFNFSARKKRSSFASYSLAMNNFLAESVDLYNRRGLLSTIRSGPSRDWQLGARRGNTNKWAMRVYIENEDTRMYDRDSAFGPPVHSSGKNLQSNKSTFNQPATRDSIILTSSVDNIAITNRLQFRSRTGNGHAFTAGDNLHRLYASNFNLSSHCLVVSYGKEDFIIKFFDSTGVHPTRGSSAGKYGGAGYYMTASHVLSDNGDIPDNRTSETGSMHRHIGSRLETSADKFVHIYKDSNIDYPIFYTNQKDDVRVASTSNVNISNGLQDGDSVDGVTLATGDRVLLKNQTDASKNGIYVVTSSGNAAARAADFDSTSEVASKPYVFVKAGSTNAYKVFTMTETAPVTIDTTDMPFAEQINDFSGSVRTDANERFQAFRRNSDYIATRGNTTGTAHSWNLVAPHETLDTSKSPDENERRIIDRWIGFEPNRTTMQDIIINVEVYISQILEYIKKHRLPSGQYRSTPEELLKTTYYTNTDISARGTVNTASTVWRSEIQSDELGVISYPSTFETHPYLVKDTSLKAFQIKMASTDSSPGPGNIIYPLMRSKKMKHGVVDEGLGVFNLTGSGTSANTFVEVGFIEPTLMTNPHSSGVNNYREIGLTPQYLNFAINTSHLSASHRDSGTYPTLVHIGFNENFNATYPYLSPIIGPNKYADDHVDRHTRFGSFRELLIPTSRLRRQVGSGSMGHDYITSEEFFDILADGINYNSALLGFRARSYTNYKGIKRFSYTYDEQGRNIGTVVNNEVVEPFSYKAYLKIEATNPGDSKMSVILSNSGSINKIFGPLDEDQRRHLDAFDRTGYQTTAFFTPAAGASPGGRYNENIDTLESPKLFPAYRHHMNEGLEGSLVESSEIAFSGGREADPEVVKSLDVQNNWSYDPYVPPFLKPVVNSEEQPYIDVIVDYSAVEDPQAPVNDPAFILQHTSYESSYAKRDYSSTGGSAYIHAMSLSASLNLATIVPDLTNPEVENISESPKVWVISPKWESPILDFSDVSQTVQRVYQKDTQGDESIINGEYQVLSEQHNTPPYLGTNPDKLYITSSKGMWHQYSTINEGYNLKVAAHPDTSNYQDLAKALGFINEEGEISKRTLGLVRGSEDTEKKVISEAIVAIPYQRYTDIDNTIQYKTIPFRKMKEGTPGNIINSHDFINIMDAFVTSENNRDRPNEEFINNLRLDIGIQSQLELMDEFIIPPQYDFLRADDGDEETMVMFILPFYHELSSLDVMNWWQNLPPSIAREPKIANSYATHAMYPSTGLVEGHSLGLSEGETIVGLTPDIIFDDLRWKIFKVKQRSKASYNKKLLSSYLGEDFEVSRADEILQNSLGTTISDGNPIDRYLLSKQGITWNWPYDYFSLVELVSIDTKFNFEARSEEVEGPNFGAKHQFGVSKKIYEVARKMRKRRLGLRRN